MDSEKQFKHSDIDQFPTYIAAADFSDLIHSYNSQTQRVAIDCLEVLSIGLYPSGVVSSVCSL
jgi:hypothetical protein